MRKASKKKGINGRDKGNRGQNAVAKLLTAWWGAKFASTPQSGGFATKQFRDDWNAAGDVVTPDLDFPFCVEVKWHERWHMEQLLKSDVCEIWQWWAQCVRETPVGKIPLLVFRRNHQPWYYMMYTNDWLVDTLDEMDWVTPMAKSFVLAAPDSHCYVMVGLFDDILSTEREQWIEITKTAAQLLIY